VKIEFFFSGAAARPKDGPSLLKVAWNCPTRSGLKERANGVVSAAGPLRKDEVRPVHRSSPSKHASKFQLATQLLKQTMAKSATSEEVTDIVCVVSLSAWHTHIGGSQGNCES
jgi:predicted nucleic acid-binding Zn ribbon protein